MSVWARGRECLRGVCACACTWRSSTRWSSHPCLLPTTPPPPHPLLLLLPTQPSLTSARPLITSEQPVMAGYGRARRLFLSLTLLLVLQTYASKSEPPVELQLTGTVVSSTSVMAELVLPHWPPASPQQLSHDILLSSSLSTAQRCGEGGERYSQALVYLVVCLPLFFAC